MKPLAWACESTARTDVIDVEPPGKWGGGHLHVKASLLGVTEIGEIGDIKQEMVGFLVSNNTTHSARPWVLT